MKMEQKDVKKFAQLLMVLNEMFVGNKEISENLVEIYFRALLKFKIEDIQKAADDLINSWKFNFLPKPVEFIERISGSEEDDSLRAWELTLETLEKVGTYKSVEFEDKRIHSAIRACDGWIELGNCSLDELKWKQKEFERTYKAHKSEHPDYLVGRHELGNAKKGITIDKPVLIVRELKQLT